MAGVTVGILRPSQVDSPMVAQTLRELPTLANRLEAESKQNPPDLEHLFLHRWMRYCMDRSFVTALSQPPSRDTVPLSFWHYRPMGLFHFVREIPRVGTKKLEPATGSKWKKLFTYLSRRKVFDINCCAFS
jgi:hypothetical protein